MDNNDSMNVDLEAIQRHAQDLGNNATRVFNDYKKLAADLESFSDNAMRDIKGEQFRKYINKQEKQMTKLKERFDKYKLYLNDKIEPRIEDYLGTDMRGRY